MKCVKIICNNYMQIFFYKNMFGKQSYTGYVFEDAKQESEVFHLKKCVVKKSSNKINP